MMTAQLFFTSIDDIVLLANEDQRINLTNFKKEFHMDIFGSLESFLRFSNVANSMNPKLSSCFTDAPVQFVLDQQTMLNIRIVIEVMKYSRLNLGKDIKEVFEILKKSFEKEKHTSIVKLERNLTSENAMEYLTFFNNESNFVQDELSTNYIEKVKTAKSRQFHSVFPTSWT